MVKYVGIRLSMFLNGMLRGITGGDMYETFSGHLGRSQIGKYGDFGLVWKIILWPVAKINNIIWWVIEGKWGHNERSIGSNRRR